MSMHDIFTRWSDPPRFDALRFAIRCGAMAALLGSAAPAAAQSSAAPEVFAGGELEEYLRNLQLIGKARLYPWSIRSFAPAEVERLASPDSLHPWADRYRFQPSATARLQVYLISPEGRIHYNSAFPFGPNEGAVWVGKGITSVVQAGVSARWGPASLTLAPVLFRAANASFELAENGGDGRLVYADYRFPNHIDLPQRFGDAPYSRLDPGQSSLRLDLPGVALGLSTANQAWGPASHHPILLGGNAPGFLHGFVGTSAPLNLGIARVHGRVVGGRLEQSPYSSVDGPESRRFMSGIVGVVTPRGIEGLELGAARFFHEPWPADGLTLGHVLKPIEAFYKERLPDIDTTSVDPKTSVDNQLASVFFRWVLPRSGFEVYAEYGREDHSWDQRDFLLEPDHNGGYMVGFRKVWSRGDGSLVVLRGEALNLQVSHISRVRAQWPFYIHHWLRQGHTHRGQLLGSPAGYGGSGSLLAFDHYHARGRWTIEWMRELRDEGVWHADAPADARSRLDVLHGLGVEGLLFLGRFEVTAGLRGLNNLNRNLSSNAANLNATFGLRTRL